MFFFLKKLQFSHFAASHRPTEIFLPTEKKRVTRHICRPITFS